MLTVPTTVIPVAPISLSYLE